MLVDSVRPDDLASEQLACLVRVLPDDRLLVLGSFLNSKLLRLSEPEVKMFVNSKNLLVFLS